MPLARSLLLAASRSAWLRERAHRSRIVRRSASRFMPGERFEDALAAAQIVKTNGLKIMFTQLGENVTAESEADDVAAHYIGVLRRIDESGLPAEVSVKPTQLGIDLRRDGCLERVKRILDSSAGRGVVWIDMESSEYVDPTLEVYRRARAQYSNVGVALQSGLHRTEKDLEKLLPLAPAIRLVKGAYSEPASIAYQEKKDVDESFYRLAQQLLDRVVVNAGTRTAIATHDPKLIGRIIDLAAANGVGKHEFEIAMLYGIRRAEQLRLAREGYRSVVLISYGSYWFPWYVRRLAERPANLWFVVKNLFG